LTIGYYQWPHSVFVKHICYTSSYSWSTRVLFFHSWAGKQNSTPKGGEKKRKTDNTHTHNKTKHNTQIHHLKTTFHILNTLPTYKYIRTVVQYYGANRRPPGSWNLCLPHILDLSLLSKRDQGPCSFSAQTTLCVAWDSHALAVNSHWRSSLIFLLVFQ